MPRNRTVRLAVLGSSVQRAAAAKYPSRNASALRRRLVMGGLVLLSLALITVSFRSQGVSGPQAAGAAVLRPFQVGAERLARPFRDVYGWFSGLVDAKGEADRLRAELVEARQEATQYRDAFEEAKRLRAMLAYRAPAGFPADFDVAAHAAVIGYPGPFTRELTIAAGTRHGVRVKAPVVTPEGLVGRVTAVTAGTAKVTLLVDGSSSVTAEDVSTRAKGILRGRPGSDVLVLDFVRKGAVVREGDRVITAGSGTGELPSRYPRGIGIGTVSYVSQSSNDLNKSIQVKPFVDFDSLESVMVLAPVAGTGR